MKIPVSQTLPRAPEGDPDLQLQLDLLVDGELPEDQRKALLVRLNREPASPWRDLAVRFLERQVEKETVRQLMAGGALVPVDFVPDETPVIAGSLRRRLIWTLSVAAGLLLVASTVMVTMQLSQPPTRPAAAVAFDVSLPAEAVSFHQNVPVSVPVLKVAGRPPYLPGETDPNVARQSIVIQPDGNGNAVVIPVNTMKAVVY